MKDKNFVLDLIRKSVNYTEPNAKIILYGSYARSDHNANSDLDILILVNKERVSKEDQKRIKYPLYEIEFETGTIISPLIFTENDWTNMHRITPFYENVLREGKVL